MELLSVYQMRAPRLCIQPSSSFPIRSVETKTVLNLSKRMFSLSFIFRVSSMNWWRQGQWEPLEGSLALKFLRKHEHDSIVFVISGGDGNVHEVVNAIGIPSRAVQLVLCPQGT